VLRPLQEIPWQLTSFMAINGISPNPRSAFQYPSSRGSVMGLQPPPSAGVQFPTGGPPQSQVRTSAVDGTHTQLTLDTHDARAGLSWIRSARDGLWLRRLQRDGTFPAYHRLCVVE
jgi:hypothetical protein